MPETMEVTFMTRSGSPEGSSDDADEPQISEGRRRVEALLAMLRKDPLAHPMAPEDRLKEGETIVIFPSQRKGR
jgi:hypothetical protein